MQNCFDILWWIDILMLRWGKRRGGNATMGTQCSRWKRKYLAFIKNLFSHNTAILPMSTMVKMLTMLQILPMLPMTMCVLSGQFRTLAMFYLVNLFPVLLLVEVEGPVDGCEESEGGRKKKPAIPILNFQKQLPSEVIWIIWTRKQSLLSTCLQRRYSLPAHIWV